MEDEKHPVTQREAVYGLQPSLHGARDTFAAPLVARCRGGTLLICCTISFISRVLAGPEWSWSVTYTDETDKKVVERSVQDVVVPLRRVCPQRRSSESRISLQGFAYSSGASALEMTTSSWSARQSSISPMSPSSPSMRRGGGVLLSEPSAGNDTVYDGAHQMQSTEYLFGARGGRWSTGQAYGASFRSATPRPWQRTPGFEERKTPKLGPGEYDVLRQTHVLSANSTWSSRGR